MAQRNLQLSDDLDHFINEQVASGHFHDADEVVEHALRQLASGEVREEQKIAALLEALREGDASGVYEGDAFADVRREMGWQIG